jgi:hypothetical protein
MVELKIYLSNGLNERLRRAAMNAYGYGRGSLSKAAQEALTKWCIEHDESPKQANSPEVETGRNERTEFRINPDERQSGTEKPASDIENDPSNSATETLEELRKALRPSS